MSSVAAVVLSAICLATVSAECPRVCTMDYRPVCGKNAKGEMNTFGNMCMFLGAQCSNPSAGWFMTYDGQCTSVKGSTECLQICTDDYTPVCAKNAKGEMKTFGNMCMFLGAKRCNPSAGWFMTYDGQCTSVEKRTECPQICTADYKPVCGKNSKGEMNTFGNMCMFLGAQCSNPSAGWFMTYDGQCESVEASTECLQICTDDYTPVCGKNAKGEMKTFANMCMFLGAKRCNPAIGWYMTYDGKCESVKASTECLQICTEDYTPVCGKNVKGEMKTFGNMCVFLGAQCSNPSAGWYMTYDGQCAESRAKCPQICTADYRPVCGKNSKGELNTFGNLCMFLGAQCNNPSAGWYMTYDGQC